MMMSRGWYHRYYCNNNDSSSRCVSSCISNSVVCSCGLPRRRLLLSPPNYLHRHHFPDATTTLLLIKPTPLLRRTNCTSSSSPEEAILQVAMEAVAEMLEHEFGASREDSFDISRRCPKYLSLLLLDTTTLLHDHDLLSSPLMSSTSTSTSSIMMTMELKDKLQSMGKLNSHYGILPFLESLGLRLPTATHLARSLLSSSSFSTTPRHLLLPNLIRKVKYVKEMFFSNSEDDHPTHHQNTDNATLIVRNARRMMMHLSVPVDDDVQLTLSFFEKIEARRGGLNMLPSADSSLPSLIESFPSILLLPLESSPTPAFLENLGVPRAHFGNILLLFPPIIYYDLDKVIKPRLRAFLKIGANKRDLSRMLLKYPWMLSTAIQQNYEEILSFFELEKVPRVGVDLAIRSWPILLGCSVSKMKVTIRNLSELGIQNKKLGQVIATSPQLLLQQPQEFQQVVSFFKNLGLDEELICRVLGRCPELFATSIDRNLEKKLKFLASIGVCKSQLPRVIKKYPEFFVCDVDRALSPRMKYLVKSGLSSKDVASMVGRFSPLLGYSIDEVLRPKLEFLVITMGKPVKDVVEYPRYFSYSLEKKIKPRFWALKGRNIECSLKDMLGKNDEEFTAEFMMLPAPA